MTMITPSYLGETIEYSSLHACRSTLEDPTPLDPGEDIVCVQVKCPSTAKDYLLRVPPEMQTCQEAVAWTAGFRNPNSYRPLVET